MNYSLPLKASPTGRYLQDQDGNPFLIHGDTPWALMVELSASEVITYLDDRQAKGFNAVIVELIYFVQSLHQAYNVYQQQPFTPSGNFLAPNEAYFAHCDWVISACRDRGMVAFLWL